MTVSRSIHISINGTIFPLFYGWVVFCCIYIPRLFYSKKCLKGLTISISDKLDLRSAVGESWKHPSVPLLKSLVEKSNSWFGRHWRHEIRIPETAVVVRLLELLEQQLLCKYIGVFCKPKQIYWSEPPECQLSLEPIPIYTWSYLSWHYSPHLDYILWEAMCSWVPIPCTLTTLSWNILISWQVLHVHWAGGIVRECQTT